MFPIQPVLAAQPDATSQLLPSGEGAWVLVWGCGVTQLQAAALSPPCPAHRYATQPLGLLAIVLVCSQNW